MQVTFKTIVMAISSTVGTYVKLSTVAWPIINDSWHPVQWVTNYACIVTKISTLYNHVFTTDVNARRASWSSWSSWSACSQTCNGGTRIRRRTCVGGVSCIGTNVQEQQCNTQSCPGMSTINGLCEITKNTTLGIYIHILV